MPPADAAPTLAPYLRVYDAGFAGDASLCFHGVWRLIPKIETWDNLPVAVRRHLIDRMRDRSITITDLNTVSLLQDRVTFDLKLSLRAALGSVNK